MSSTFKVGNIEVLQTPATPVNHPATRYDGYEPGVTILPVGHQKSEGRYVFTVDTIYERDVDVPMRDGTLLRGDIFRPQNATGK